MLTNISIKTFHGEQILPLIPQYAKLRAEVFNEYPYFLRTTVDFEMDYLARHAKSPHSIYVLVFDGTTLVGGSMGIPLVDEPDNLSTCFKPIDPNVGEYYYFSESMLLKKYRGLGVAHHFFNIREQYVADLNIYKKTCFYEVHPPIGSPPGEKNSFVTLHAFWHKKGYVKLLNKNRDNPQARGRLPKQIRDFWVRHVVPIAPKDELSENSTRHAFS